jgi:hypothetical protein
MQTMNAAIQAQRDTLFARFMEAGLEGRRSRFLCISNTSQYLARNIFVYESPFSATKTHTQLSDLLSYCHSQAINPTV